MTGTLYPLLRSILLASGCRIIRQGKGSHEFWESTINGHRFPVPVTLVSRNTANAILRQAGIKQKI